MSTRTLISEDENVRVYEVSNDQGEVIGRDVERKLTVEETIEQTTNERLDVALDAMRAHVARGTFTAQQRDAALLLVLRVCIGLVRLARRRFDTAD